MNLTDILAVCKFSKLIYDQNKFHLDRESLIKKYESERIEYDIILKSHEEQESCINLAKKLLPETKFIYTPHLQPKMTEDKELVISIGGDEHFKFVIHNSVRDQLVLNVRSDNLKSEGALSACNRFNLKEMVDQIKNDTYIVDEWVRLDAKLNDTPIESAIDTIFIGEKDSTRMSRYFLDYQGEREEQKSSGLLIVTGAGSTGWFSSAGGEAFPRNAKTGRFVAREIYKGTKTGSQLPYGEFNYDEEIQIISLMDACGIIEIDSIKEYPFRRGDKLKIKVSDYLLRVVLLDQKSDKGEA